MKNNIWKENHKGMTVKYTPNDKSYLAIGILSIQRDMIDRFNEDILLGQLEHLQKDYH